MNRTVRPARLPLNYRGGVGFGAVADVPLLRKDGVAHEMPMEVGLPGDTDYREDRNRRLDRERVVVEHVMARRNRFEVLRQTLRSRLARHSGAIRTVAMIVDRRNARKSLNGMQAAA